MLELLSASIAPVNLPYTVLVGLTLVYWIFVVLGALDMETLDVDLDAGGDVDLDVGADADMDLAADADADLDAGADAHSGGSNLVGGGGGATDLLHAPGSLFGTLFVSTLRFFNVGEVPLTIVLSFLFASMWACSILVNDWLGERASVATGLALFPPNLIAGLFVAKIATTPFRAIFRRLDTTNAEDERIVGKTCTIRTGEATQTFGQAEVTTSGAPHIVNVRTREGVSLRKGEQAIVFKFDPKRDVYLIDRID